MSAELSIVYTIHQKSNSAVVDKMLATEGFYTESYRSAEEFLESFDPRRAGCALVDVMLPGMTGLELQAELNAKQSNLPIIFLAGDGTIAHCVQAMKAGAVDFLERPYRQGRLRQSVSEALAERIQSQQTELRRETLKQRFEQLTRREREILAQLVSGVPVASSEQIAARLHISRRTVEHHRAAIKKKMRASSLLELIDMARMCGFH